MHCRNERDAEQTMAKKRTEHHSWVGRPELPGENGPAKPECGVESTISIFCTAPAIARNRGAMGRLRVNGDNAHEPRTSGSGSGDQGREGKTEPNKTGMSMKIKDMPICDRPIKVSWDRGGRRFRARDASKNKPNGTNIRFINHIHGFRTKQTQFS